MHLKFDLRAQIALIVAFSLAFVWGVAIYELQRSHDAVIHESEVRTKVQAQVFAEYSRSSIKRINEFILDVRVEWTGDVQRFVSAVRRGQENIDDLTFQVSAIDRDGFLAYSNLAKPNDRTDLSEREHFRVHREAGNVDRLFISRPLKGKVSGKWSIQMTRPIWANRRFNGVLVVSVSPDQFAGFAGKMGIGGETALTIVRESGEIMARYPSNEGALGQVLKDRPFMQSDAPLSGNFRRVAAVDGRERVFGYHRLPEYGMTFVVSDTVADVLAPYRAYRQNVVGAASAVSALALLLFFMLYRSLSVQEETRRQLDAIFQLSPDGFVSFDAKRRVKYVSPAFEVLTGLPAERVAGLDSDEFSELIGDLCHPAARFRGIDGLASARAQKGQSPRRELIELSMPPHRVLEVVLRRNESATVSQILNFRDVTHETEIDRMKSEFLATAAHELRTPMSSILGFSELLLVEKYDNETQHELLDTIYRQSQLMASLINELLDLARIEARRGKDFVIEPFALEALVEETAAAYKPPEQRSPPQITPPPAQLGICGDRKKIQQAVTNLISNAYKYSPDGGDVYIRYRTQSECGQNFVGVECEDQGIGMTPEQLSRVCERFYRADTSGKIPGTGLGLSIVKEIVELHGGKLNIVSKFGSGTQVTLWFPEGDLTAGASSAAKQPENLDRSAHHAP